MSKTAVEIFTRIVQIDSPTGEEDQMADHLMSWLAELGYSPHKDEHNNVFVQTKGEGEPIFLNAHIDTVEPGRGIVPIIVDGIIRSQGETILGADNKVAVAAIIWTLAQLASGDLNARPLDILFTTSEEVGNYGAIGFDKSRIRAKIGYCFDKAGDLGEIIAASPYYARFDIVLQGKASHAAYRAEAVPVIDVIPNLISAIESLRAEGVLINIGRIGGGSARNTVMGDLTINGEIRSFDEALFEKAMLQLQKICDRHEGQVIITNATVVENPGYVHPPEALAPVVEQLRSILGQEPVITTSCGCADANIFNEFPEQLRVFNLSSGDHDSHTVHEHVSVADLEALGRLVLGLVINT